jgi:hypothetical protein
VVHRPPTTDGLLNAETDNITTQLDREERSTVTKTPDDAPNAPEEESLAVPVGGNALNPDGNATHSGDKLGAGTPAGIPEANDSDADSDSGS